MASRIAQSLAEFVDRLVDTLVEVDEGVVRPQPGAQFFPGDQFAGSVDQRTQDIERLALQLDAGPVFADFPGNEIDVEHTEPGAPEPIRAHDPQEYHPMPRRSILKARE